MCTVALGEYLVDWAAYVYAYISLIVSTIINKQVDSSVWVAVRDEAVCGSVAVRQCSNERQRSSLRKCATVRGLLCYVHHRVPLSIILSMSKAWQEEGKGCRATESSTVVRITSLDLQSSTREAQQKGRGAVLYTSPYTYYHQSISEAQTEYE